MRGAIIMSSIVATLILLGNIVPKIGDILLALFSVLFIPCLIFYVATCFWVSQYASELNKSTYIRFSSSVWEDMDFGGRFLARNGYIGFFHPGVWCALCILLGPVGTVLFILAVRPYEPIRKNQAWPWILFQASCIAVILFGLLYPNQPQSQVD